MSKQLDTPMYVLDPTEYDCLPDDAVFLAEVVSGVWFANVFRLPNTGEYAAMLWDECDIFEPSEPEYFDEARLRAMHEDNEAKAIDAQGIYGHIASETRRWLNQMLDAIERDRHQS